MANNKDIKYSGYSAVPSDYECQDGDLAASINLINEDGALHPIAAPKIIASLPDDYAFLFVHTLPTGARHLFFYSPVENRTIWFDSTDFDTPRLFSSKAVSPTAATIGNTLIIRDTTALHYYLFDTDNDAYIDLGYAPTIDVEFSLASAGVFGSGIEAVSTRTFTGTCHVNTFDHGVDPPEDTQTLLKEVTDFLMGELLSRASDKATSKGHFYLPFLVCYAVQLFDGSYAWHSDPVLLVPQLCPIIGGTCNTTFDNGTSTVDVSADWGGIVSCALMAKVTSNLARWKDVAQSIDVFVSAPIYPFKTDENNPKYTTVKNVFEDLGADGGLSSFFNGRVAYYLDKEGQYAKFEDIVVNASGKTWQFPPNENFLEDIRTCAVFYKIARLPVSTNHGFKELELDTKNLSALQTLPTLTDGYQSRHGFVPKVLYSYNSRLHMGNVDIYPPAPQTPYSFCGGTDSVSSDPLQPQPSASAWVNLTRYGHEVSSAVGEYSVPQKCQLLSEVFPRYIFYPDVYAEYMLIKQGNDVWRITLKPHQLLNGAVWCDASLFNPSPVATLPINPSPSSDAYYSAPEKVYGSEVSNPFYFPLTNITSVGSTAVRALASAARPLSQGQFGQFPLYAFTDDGVWALEISGTGTISARQPITSDVCISTSGITQLDSAVVFPTNRGVMLLSGSQAQCFSSAIAIDSDMDVSRLPHLTELHDSLTDGIALDKCFPMKPFSEYLDGCRIVYDYVHQRIIVFNSAYTYAYVYSLKSSMWGMLHTRIISAIPSYPNAMAMTLVDGRRNIVDFSLPNHEGESVSALLVTRPLKLDAPDVLKTVDTIIQRGHFRKGHVKSVLYASRDLYNWQLVWSSTDHYLRGFRGTPYKYFRIALLCEMDADESIYGASVSFNPRHTNQLR